MSFYANRIIIALDTQDFEMCKKWVKALRAILPFFKVGSELFTSVGQDAVRFIKDEGGEVFLDLKFHDIPQTVAKSAAAAASLGVKMFNVHTLGGSSMMRAAREAVPQGKSWVLGVTILTSHTEEDIQRDLKIGNKLPDQVVHLAKLAETAGLDGVVASAQELDLIRKHCGPQFKVVTPGIRPAWAEVGDQKRVMTPRQAFEKGADYIVIGRPVTGAKDLKEAALKVLEEIES